MKEINTDILIVGSGLVGLVAAHSLSSQNYKVTLIEKKNFLDPKKKFMDTRTVAVSEGSKIFLDNLSIWDHLKKYVEPISTINVFDRTSKNKIIFNNKLKNAELGYVIKNEKFSHVLIKKLQKYKNTKLIYGSKLRNIKFNNKGLTAFTNKNMITPKLTIAADGKNSEVKKILGDKSFVKKYEEVALVLNFFHEKTLKNTAFEIFYETGPLAILPMQSSGGFNQSTIIWSNKNGFFNNLLSCEKKFIGNLLEEKIGKIVGKIFKINSSQLFQLSAHINDTFFNKHLVYIGDSAHSIHPIAGQGWNLGIKDVINLHTLANEYGDDIGSNSFCKSYNNLSYNKAFQLFQITDKLNLHFKNKSNLYRLFSYGGFKLIQNTNALKNQIAKYAMGI